MHALEREECGSVGDRKKGILIAPPVGTSFACPAHSALRAACTHEEEELNAILSGLERTQASEPS